MYKSWIMYIASTIIIVSRVVSCLLWRIEFSIIIASIKVSRIESTTRENVAENGSSSFCYLFMFLLFFFFSIEETSAATFSVDAYKLPTMRGVSSVLRSGKPMFPSPLLSRFALFPQAVPGRPLVRFHLLLLPESRALRVVSSNARFSRGDEMRDFYFFVNFFLFYVFFYLFFFIAKHSPIRQRHWTTDAFGPSWIVFVLRDSHTRAEHPDDGRWTNSRWKKKKKHWNDTKKKGKKRSCSRHTD